MRSASRLPGLATALLAAVCLVPTASAAPTLTAEPPQVSGGGEASGRPVMSEQVPSGPYGSPAAPRRRAAPHGVVGPAFEGFGYDDNFTENGFRTIPPDPIGAAGPDRLLAVVNTMIEARTKGGALLYRDALKDFFAPLAGCALLTFPFDPKIVYDTYAGRFVVVALERANDGSNPAPGNVSRILLAVSKTSAPVTATAADWWFHCIDSKISSGGIDYWADYPGLEVDEDAVYVTNNMFSFPGVPGSYLGARLWIVHKGTAGGFYAGGAATVTVHDPYTLPGSVATTTMPAQVHGAGGVAPGVGTFLVSYSGISDGVDEFIQVVRVDDPLGTAGGPTFVGPDFVNLGNIETLGAGLPDAPQPGTAQPVEVNDRRALDAVARGGALWLTMTITPDGPALPALADHTTAYWVMLSTAAVTGSGSPAGLITLSQQGGIAGEEVAGLPGGAVYTFFPSVAVNAAGTAAFGFAACGTNVYAGAYATLRRASDPAGATDPAVAVEPGRDHYVRTFDGPPCDATPARNRWGDYSGIAVDPANDAAFWVFNQFADFRGSPSTGGCNGRPDPEDGRWGTAWGVLGLTPTVSLNSVSLAEGNAGTAALTFTVTVSAASVADISVSYATSDGTAIASNGDYVTTSGVLNIPAGATLATIPVTVNGDGYPEPDETFTLTLSAPVNASLAPGGGLGTITNDDGTTAVDGLDPAELALRTLSPSPGRGPARLEFDLPREATIDLSVLDVQGQRVARLASGPHRAGRHTVVWEIGRGPGRVPAGIYFVRLATPAGGRTRRLVVL